MGLNLSRLGSSSVNATTNSTSVATPSTEVSASVARAEREQQAPALPISAGTPSTLRSHHLQHKTPHELARFAARHQVEAKPSFEDVYRRPSRMPHPQYVELMKRDIEAQKERDKAREAEKAEVQQTREEKMARRQEARERAAQSAVTPPVVPGTITFADSYTSPNGTIGFNQLIPSGMLTPSNSTLASGMLGSVPVFGEINSEGQLLQLETLNIPGASNYGPVCNIGTTSTGSSNYVVQTCTIDGAPSTVVSRFWLGEPLPYHSYMIKGFTPKIVIPNDSGGYTLIDDRSILFIDHGGHIIGWQKNLPTGVKPETLIQDMQGPQTRGNVNLVCQDTASGQKVVARFWSDGQGFPSKTFSLPSGRFSEGSTAVAINAQNELFSSASTEGVLLSKTDLEFNLQQSVKLVSPARELSISSIVPYGSDWIVLGKADGQAMVAKLDANLQVSSAYTFGSSEVPSGRVNLDGNSVQIALGSKVMTLNANLQLPECPPVPMASFTLTSQPATVNCTTSATPITEAEFNMTRIDNVTKSPVSSSRERLCSYTEPQPTQPPIWPYIVGPAVGTAALLGLGITTTACCLSRKQKRALAAMSPLPKIAFEDVRMEEVPFAHGTTAQVYGGRYMNAPVAIKVMNPGSTPAEGVSMAKLALLPQSTGYVRCFGQTTLPDGRTALILEFMPGGTLNGHIRRHSADADFDLGKLLNIAHEITSELEGLHTIGLVHRDLKGANVLVTEDGHPKLADFGLITKSRAPLFSPTATSLTSGIAVDSTPCGSPVYCDPLVLQGSAPTKESDIYSLGVVLWEIFSGGQLPYEHETNVQALVVAIIRDGLRPPIPTNWPPKVVALIQRCWDADPAVRPTVAEVKHTIEECIAEHQQTALQANPLASGRPHTQAHRGGRRGHRGRGQRSVSHTPVAAPQEFEPPTIELTPPSAAHSGGSGSSTGRPGPSEPTLEVTPVHSSSARLGSTVGRGGPSSLELRPVPTTGGPVPSPLRHELVESAIPYVLLTPNPLHQQEAKSPV